MRDAPVKRRTLGLRRGVLRKLQDESPRSACRPGRRSRLVNPGDNGDRTAQRERGNPRTAVELRGEAIASDYRGAVNAMSIRSRANGSVRESKWRLHWRCIEEGRIPLQQLKQLQRLRHCAKAAASAEGCGLPVETRLRMAANGSNRANVGWSDPRQLAQPSQSTVNRHQTTAGPPLPVAKDGPGLSGVYHHSPQVTGVCGRGDYCRLAASRLFRATCDTGCGSWLPREAADYFQSSVRKGEAGRPSRL